MRHLLRTIKRLPLYALFGRWRTTCPYEPGYTIALPMPMDMPFLLRLALESLNSIDTTNCNQILIVPDGWGDDRGDGLRRTLREFDDPRLEMVHLRWVDYRAIRAMRSSGSRTHWIMIINAVIRARHEYVFLHDADAFFLDHGGLERQYSEAKQRSMAVLGVDARWDPFFTEQGMTIAGTWEMLFSTRWARRRSPMALFPGTWRTVDGAFGFDTMLYAQFLDHEQGAIGIMDQPPHFVHFNGTICTYRSYRSRSGTRVTDELFRLLLLSAIETALNVGDNRRATPSVEELARGLKDPSATVQYGSDLNHRGYPEFRHMLEQMCESPAFVGDRAEVILRLLEPFDQHFDFESNRAYNAALGLGQMRATGLQ